MTSPCRHPVRSIHAAASMVFLVLSPIAVLSGGACTKSSESGARLQTQWLRECSRGDECGDLSCICGRCIMSCASDPACSDAAPNATCQAADSNAARALCDGTTAEAVCLAACGAGCPAGQSCVDEVCLPDEVGSGGPALRDAATEGGAGSTGNDSASAFDCSASIAAIKERIDAAVTAAASVDCAADDDCVRVDTQTACTTSCGEVVPRAQMSELAAAVSAAATDCDAAVAEGCQRPPPALCEEPSPPRCVDHVCR